MIIGTANHKRHNGQRDSACDELGQREVLAQKRGGKQQRDDGRGVVEGVGDLGGHVGVHGEKIT